MQLALLQKKAADSPLMIRLHDEFTCHDCVPCNLLLLLIYCCQLTVDSSQIYKSYLGPRPIDKGRYYFIVIVWGSLG